MFTYNSSKLSTPRVPPARGAIVNSREESDEKLISVPRFQPYFSTLSSIDLIPGSEEPEILRASRPFLLSNEVSSGRSSKNKKNSKEVSQTYESSSRVPMLIQSNPNQIYKICRTASYTQTTSTTLPTLGGFIETLNQINDATILRGVFDEYRIALVEIWFDSNVTENNSAALAYGQLLTGVCYTDANAPATLADMRDQANCVETNALTGHYHRFVPHAALAAYSGTFTSYSNVEAPWIDTNSPSVEHYGLKFAISAQSSVNTYYVTSKVWFEFRHSS